MIANKLLLITQKLGIMSVLVLSLSMMSESHAAVRDQAKRMHDRLAGVPPSTAVLDSMEAQLNAGNGVGAAQIAMQNPNFYNSTLKNFAAPWTNSEHSVGVDLNDYSATVIGMIRDDMDFRQVLFGDILYTANGSVTTNYSQTNNTHYTEIESNYIDMSDASKLVQTTQSSAQTLALSINATAGIMTTRQSAKAFLDAGTNRRLFEYTLYNHLCISIEDANDITRTPDRVRKDISRRPGGDSSVYLNTCIGCHSGMDPMIQSFAYYNYNSDTAITTLALNQLIFDNGNVQSKYTQNSGSFALGYQTLNDSWDNYWRAGKNALLGWSWQGNPTVVDASGNSVVVNGSGVGAKSMGAELAYSKAFASCQVKKVFQTVCLRPASSPADRVEIERVTTVFHNSVYKMKTVFAEVANYCKGN